MKSPINVVILAAGLGTRMKSKRAKVLHRAGGLTLVEHVVHAAAGLTSAEHITVVVGQGGAGSLGCALRPSDRTKRNGPRCYDVPRRAGAPGRPGCSALRRLSPPFASHP